MVCSHTSASVNVPPTPLKLPPPPHSDAFYDQCCTHTERVTKTGNRGHSPGAGAVGPVTGHRELGPGCRCPPQESHGSWPSYSTQGRSLQFCLLMSWRREKKLLPPGEGQRRGAGLQGRAAGEAQDDLQRPSHNLQGERATGRTEPLRRRVGLKVQLGRGRQGERLRYGTWDQR